MTRRERLVYGELLPKIARRVPSIEISSTRSISEVHNAYKAIMQDLPELFWLNGKAVIETRTVGGVTSLSLTDYCTADNRLVAQQERQVRDELSAFARSLPRNTTSYDKVRAAYEYVIHRTSYDESAPNGQSITGVFIDKRAVCAGYSSAFCYLLRMNGVACGCVVGSTVRGGPHRWNLVQIDGMPSWVDCTWGDPQLFSRDGRRLAETISYAYLCVMDRELKRTHTPDKGQLLPICDRNRYDWYKQNGLLLSTFSAVDMDALLCRRLSAGYRFLEVKFDNDQSFAKAIDYVSTEKIFLGEFGKRLAALARKSHDMVISYRSSKVMLTVSVRW